MIKAIIFDFDGVLVDSFELAMSIMREQEMVVTSKQYKDHHNGNVFKKPVITFTDKGAREFFKKYYNYADVKYLLPLKDQIVDLSKKFKLFIISSNTELGIKKYLRLGGLDKYFKKIYGVETAKSKVKKFKMFFDEYNLKSNECIFVTDTLGDVLEGKEVGVKIIAVTWGFHGEGRLRTGQPDLIINDFKELIPVINNFDK